MHRTFILSLILSLTATQLFGAEEKTSPWETALKATSSVLGAGRDYAEAIGDAKKLRPSDFNRLVYGNTAARKQLANRTNQWSESCKGLAESKTGQVIKWGSKISEGGATLTGQLSAGDVRGATATLINTQMEEWTGAGGTALGAKMLGGIGLLVGGPIGGMVGGAVGGVAGGILAVTGYDAYLAPWVERTVDQVWADTRTPWQKAWDSRTEFLDRQQRLNTLITEQSMLSSAGYGEQGAAEVVLRSPFSIPQTCTLHLVCRWAKDPKYTWTRVLHIRNGRITVNDEEGKWHGTLVGNVATGSGTGARGGGGTERIVFHPSGNMSWDGNYWGVDSDGVMHRSSGHGVGTWRIESTPPQPEKK